MAAENCDWLKLAAREQRNTALYLYALVHARGRMMTLYRSVDDVSRENVYAGATTLYAIQRYPAPLGLSLLRVVRAALTLAPPWGWSSHTTGTLDCVLAARLGATVIEKHLALERHDTEARHSLLPSRFAAMCRTIRKDESHGN